MELDEYTLENLPYFEEGELQVGDQLMIPNKKLVNWNPTYWEWGVDENLFTVSQILGTKVKLKRFKGTTGFWDTTRAARWFPFIRAKSVSEEDRIAAKQKIIINRINKLYSKCNTTKHWTTQS